MRLQLRVEDLFLDDLVDGQLALDGREQLGSGLHAALGRGLEFGQQLLDLVVVSLEQRDRVHEAPQRGYGWWDSARFRSPGRVRVRRRPVMGTVSTSSTRH
jgi:hypothetical protein